MKYTINDFAGASYEFDLSGNELRVIDLGFNLTKGNIYTIINTTRNKIMYRVDIPMELNITSNRIDLHSLDTTDMSNGDEIMLIMDLPLQKGVEVLNDVGVVVTNGAELLQELEDINDTILELTQRLAFLPAVRGTLNSIRSEIINTVAVTVSSGTITTVTTVGTLSNITSI